MASINTGFNGLTKLRDWWSVVKTNFININTQIVNHVAGTSDKHPAQDVTYSGSVSGSNVKQAVDNLKTDINNIAMTGSEHDALVTAALVDVEEDDFGPDGENTGLDGRLGKWEQRTIDSEAAHAAHLAETVNVLQYGAVGDEGVTDDSDAFQAAYAVAMATGKKVVVPGGRTYKIGDLIIDSDIPITQIAYGAIFIPKNTNPMITIKSSKNKLFGGKVIPLNQVTPDQHVGIKIMNTADNNAVYNIIQHMEFYSIYQAIDDDMDGSGTTAAYRNRVIDCIIENGYQKKTWAGSFGVRFTGNTHGNSAANDSKIEGTKIKGYEKNTIFKNGVAPKIIDSSIDSGAIAIELDGTDYLSVMQSYFEYNDTFIKALNTPYRPMSVSTTIANYVTLIDGAFYNNEKIISFDFLAPQIRVEERTVNGTTYTALVRTGSGHGGGLSEQNDNKTLDFMKIGAKFGLLPSEDIDFYHHIGTGKKHYFGNIIQTQFAAIGELGDIEYRSIRPVFGLQTFTSADTSPAVDKSNIFTTANGGATSITRFDFGFVGHQFTIIAGDANTTLVNGTYIKMKSGANKTLANGETVTFICFSAPTNSTCVYYEI